MASTLEVTVSEFVALLNQTLEYAYPGVTVKGELANLRISKNRWVYFDLKDDDASVRFFGTVYQMPGPLEDGMMLSVTGVPRLHPLYGFSVTVQRMQPTGEGSIKKAAALLEAKLKAEGLFDEARKRALPYPPKRIGLITSGESAAYRDFMKIITARWGGVHIIHVDVQVQGDPAVAQIVAAVQQVNAMADPPEVVVITRGGGSADDLQAFNTEQVTRAVAASRIPTLVAIGHEVDVSLAELAADVRASTPSNAAELLVPDREAVLQHLHMQRQRLGDVAVHTMQAVRQHLERSSALLHDAAQQVVTDARRRLTLRHDVLRAYDPQAALHRGYAIIRSHDTVVRSGAVLQPKQSVAIRLADADITATVDTILMRTEDA